MVFIGVDGCRGGWFFVRRNRNVFDFGVVQRLQELVEQTSESGLLLVDIPIGLRDGSNRPRACDVTARRLLGPKRASSVFPAPVRGVLQATDYSNAVELSQRLIDKGISRQVFAIVPKIREVDDLLATSKRARELIKEVHPELCFWALNGRKPMRYRKKSAEGFEERMNLLQSMLPEAKTVCENALTQYPRKHLARDDIGDALVALATATAPLGVQLTVPANPELDSRGRPMQMVYALTAGSAVGPY